MRRAWHEAVVSRLAFAASAAMLAGCSGVQYVPPPDSLLAARLAVVERTRGMSAAITSFSKKGCYVGETFLRSGQDQPMTLLHPEQEIFVAVKQQGTACGGFSFVPEPGARYELAVDAPKGVGLCASELNRLDADGTRNRVKTTFFYIKMGRPGCLRAARFD